MNPTRNKAAAETVAVGEGWDRVRRRTFAPTILGERLVKRARISLIRYSAARFLRWILPLKLRRTTVEETAARPMVPIKATPSFRTK